MFAPIDFTRLESALATSAGWLELGLVLACLAAAAFVDWLLWQRSRTAHEGGRVRFPGGLGRVVFPLLALALLFVARLAFQRFAGPPFFIDIALPLLVALAAIRMFVYGLRRLSLRTHSSNHPSVRSRSLYGARSFFISPASCRRSSPSSTTSYYRWAAPRYRCSPSAKASWRFWSLWSSPCGSPACSSSG